MHLFDALRYGAIGLGAILAILAYRLLRREQDQEAPRHQVIVAIYVYMIFSLIFFGGGLALELLRDNMRDTQRERDLDARIDTRQAPSSKSNPGPTPSENPQVTDTDNSADLTASVTGQWDIIAVAVAGVNSSGQRFDMRAENTFRIELVQDGDRVTGKYVWATNSACSRANIAGARTGARLNLLADFQGQCCRGATERLSFRLLSPDRMSVDLQPEGIPPLADCTLTWGRGLATRAK